ncbi:hypothetical protein AA313_de0209144 [Arthrobotrys entomopaga]|nr:hypothetical protein AA313_de0209144 [Arthrobotrys entomopaga]
MAHDPEKIHRRKPYHSQYTSINNPNRKKPEPIAMLRATPTPRDLRRITRITAWKLREQRRNMPETTVKFKMVTSNNVSENEDRAMLSRKPEAPSTKVPCDRWSLQLRL